ncbi:MULTISPECIES: FixH family protein [Nitrospirillum]|nr:FixH family protein [Nitrospirillum amazonense]MEC4591285.1 FixH family protein [Nitrospirillum amazonense]TWB30726.1 nitrogen fixation protein FixH [Nitrospirillum amazonense]TWB34859.1 nitrogen fixation protein FixH [Nitrospirillum amazonense]TWB63577.1 nitrogen fixation protein FixH [Nitrospirillum amazonense]
MTVIDMPRRQPLKPKRSLIPWIFVGGMGVVIVVNSILIYYAMHSWTGIVTAKPYERGIEYNKVLEAQAQQDALGWVFDADIEPAADSAKGTGVLTVRITDRDGAVLDGMALTGRLVRPIDIMPDVPLTFTASGNGRYTATVALPKHGQWDLKLKAEKGPHWYHLTRRLFVK